MSPPFATFDFDFEGVVHTATWREVHRRYPRSYVVNAPGYATRALVTYHPITQSKWFGEGVNARIEAALIALLHARYPETKGPAT